MKRINKFFIFINMILMLITHNVFAASAYLEGEEIEQGTSFLDNFDAALLMANWYKIILIAVAIVCCAGFIVSNVRKNFNKKSNDK